MTTTVQPNDSVETLLKKVLTVLNGGNNAVTSDITGIVGASKITNIVAISQANYDAIASPSATTFYVITG